jgi:hypothetical protein
MYRLPRFILPTLVTCCAFLLPAGPAAAIDVCGDGICNANAVPPETLYCEADCGPIPDPEPPPCVIDTCDNGSCSEPPAGVDLDGDSVPDLLENQLAHKFFPAALLQWEDVDRDASYLFNQRSTPYTLQPYVSGIGTLCDAPLECLEIRWGITFFFDHGDVFDGGHLGDSEMYAALLRRNQFWDGSPTDPVAWEMIRDFTSAHWGAFSDSSKVGSYGYCPLPCGLYARNPQACNSRSTCVASGQCQGHSACVNFTTKSECTPRGCTWVPFCTKSYGWKCYGDLPLTDRATIFCAERKHALYHTDGECDGGAFWKDECPNNEIDLSTQKEGLLQNVGNPSSHDGFDTTIQFPTHCGFYDVWSGAKFGESSSYLQHFTAPLRWALD